MSFRQCVRCGFDLDLPNMAEDLVRGQECPRCYHNQPQWQTVKQWLVELKSDLDERIITLQTRVDKLERKLPRETQ